MRALYQGEAKNKRERMRPGKKAVAWRFALKDDVSTMAKRRLWAAAIIAGTALAGAARTSAQPASPSSGLSYTTNSLTWATNGDGVYAVSGITISNTLINPRWLELKRPLPAHLQPRVETNSVFDHFVPGSFSERIWTNVIARTNGRSMVIWEERRHPEGWPEKPPVVKWNTRSLLWGMRGLTALSPCWAGEGSSGQVPVTALTRRHGYTRGHGMGPEGFVDARKGQPVWFFTRENKRIRMKIIGEVVRLSKGDYTLFLFDRDLPAGVTPLRAISYTEYSRIYPYTPGAPHPLFGTEQGGQVSAGFPGFSVNILKGGDSGSPNLLPLDDELVFVSGRTTSPATPEMQADMDELCRRHHLNPEKYRIGWVHP